MAVTRFSSRLLEREHEMALLTRAWHDARAGRGSAWLVCAEAGGGKTRLMTELARATGARLLWGAAEPVAPPDPYLAVMSALPGFRPAPARTESVVAAVMRLREIAGGSPVMLVLDDLHFGDDGTTAVLVRLCAECRRERWLVLAAFRPGEGPISLQAAATELVAHDQARRLNLPPLSLGSVTLVVNEIRGRAVAPVEVEHILSDSGGNPWFVEALARGNGAVSAARDRLALRLDRLEQSTPGAWRVAATISPATHPLPHDVLAHACGGDTPTLRRTLAGLRDAGVLHEEDGAWRFHHDLLRRALLETMIDAERRDAHRALAETMEQHDALTSAGATRAVRTSAAELAMLYAAAGDPRAVPHALRAAQEARAVDAHEEALAQLKRALSYALEDEQRRTTLLSAAVECYDLGRFAENLGLAEEALTIPGGAPETLARLHQLAARAAFALGDAAADTAHLDAAEALLAGQPPGPQAAQLALARVARAAIQVQPHAIGAPAARALHLAHALQDDEMAARIEASVRSFLIVSALDRGDPAGFGALAELLERAAAHGLPPGVAASALANAYEEAVISQFHADATRLGGRVLQTLQQHELGWSALIDPYRVLELVQRGRYEESVSLEAAIAVPADATIEAAVLACARVLREVRAGSLERARSLVESFPRRAGFQAEALMCLAELEIAAAERTEHLGDQARAIYGQMDEHQYARVAGTAAVVLARSLHHAPPAPDWLVADAPLRVLWAWAAGIAAGDRSVLLSAAARLRQMDCPYEAALALADAEELGDAYRALRALGATRARLDVAARLRASARPIPRRRRAETQRDALSDTERTVCTLVAQGARNEEIARTLGVSLRTVETHLSHIYQKTGQRGRAALAAWWSREGGGGSGLRTSGAGGGVEA